MKVNPIQFLVYSDPARLLAACRSSDNVKPHGSTACWFCWVWFFFYLLIKKKREYRNNLFSNVHQATFTLKKKKSTARLMWLPISSASVFFFFSRPQSQLFSIVSHGRCSDSYKFISIKSLWSESNCYQKEMYPSCPASFPPFHSEFYLRLNWLLL